VQTVNQNPVGVAGATAGATVHWADGTTSTQTVTTSRDGLAVFALPLAGKAGDSNTVTLVEVDFTSQEGATCQVKDDRQAFFTLLSPTPTQNPKKKGDHRHHR
jgi:hypothetical protein